MEIAVKNENTLDSPTEGTGVGGSSDTGSGAELQKQLSLEKSVNSHHHDSEYDTASDLEDYSEDGESVGAEEKENGSSTGSDFEDDGEGGEDDEEENEDDENKKKVDYTKKVDEDRSNPQYIPKKGTFYEHDDRTADDSSSVIQISDKATDGEANTKATNNAPDSTNSASKTMKQWQPASAMDRWSHDRYDESEQAPKSRTELVSAYGYDIRSEDAPPHARRKRHYGRGPSKYNRKWEDESAYIKSNNNQRKPPRPEDFPSLGDKRSQKRDQRLSRSKEEKENHYENREPRGDRNDRKRDNYRRNDRDRRINKSYNGHKTVEFKNRNRSNNNNFENQRKSQNSNDLNDKSQVESLSFTNTKVSNNPTSTSNANIKLTPPQHQPNERYNGHSTISNEQIIDNKQSNNANYKLPQLQQSQQQPKLQNAIQTTSSQLSARLQQVASNAPSHVGSVQMHSLATQQGTQPLALVSPIDIHQHQEPGRPKRYSSLRSRQTDQAMPPQPPANIDQHANATLQQLQQYEVNSQQRQQVLLQANLLQLYQENIQAQMQGVVPIQTIQQPQTQQKPPSQFQNPPPSYQNTPGAAYYTQPPPPTASADYSYLPQQQPSVVSAGPPQIPYHGSAAPNPASYVQAQAAPNPVPAGPAPAAAPYPNYPQTTPQPQPYQPYNTVGGTTYFVGHTQPAPRTTTTLPQRRPTNAIPILAPPSDKNKANNMQLDKDSGNNAINDAESIDHILDNMFVQRQYQPQQIQPAANAAVNITAVNNTNTSTNTDSSVASSADTNKIEDAMKSVSINDPTTAPSESIIENAENSPPQTQS